MKRILSVAFLMFFIVSMADAQRDSALHRVLDLTAECGCNFIYTKHVKGEDKPVKKLGMLYFTSPDKLSVLFSNPKGDKYVIVSDKIYDQQGKRGLIYKFDKHESKKKSASLFMRALMGKIVEIEKLIGVKAQFEEDKSFYIFSFENSNKNIIQYKKVRLLYSKLDYHLCMVVLEGFKDEITTYCMPIKKNVKIKESIYEIPTTTK